MFEDAIEGLAAILDSHSWVGELAGILPLSALVDFIDVPPKLHMFQLAGTAPLWSWPVTPAGSRLLLSDDRSPEQQNCFLDRHGNSVALLGLDGRYGDRYYVSSPETLRLCVRAHRKPYIIDNLHDNMKGDDLRIQNLEIIHVSRRQAPNGRQPSSPLLRQVFLAFPWMSSWRFVATSAIGWVALLAMIAMSAILQTYLSLAFLVLMPLTGSVVLVLYGINPRRLLVNSASEFNRLILVAEHLNATDWIVFYGESTILNSLLNRPLEPRGPKKRPAHTAVLRMILRIFVVGQWALALGASATKDWNAYFICFWIALCIIVHAYMIPPQREAKEWMKSYAGFQMERYQTRLSSRRALLNTVVALNPDTFALLRETQKEDRTKLDDEAVKWIDPILERGLSRTKWEQATLGAMNEAAAQASPEDMEMDAKHRESFPSEEWKREYQKEYWSPFITEGIYMAAKIREKANLPGRMVRNGTE
ncbi:hypothetical protein F4779DRAFT_622243 [Xylariaceae sp. FL0662B]|nr:hypothetical protein F4779DRAFT_622243 [Xylariaceae sp. FL0662B]